MKKHVVMALTNPVAGREEDYNAWFEGTHIPEVLATPGFLAAQRYEVSEHQRIPDALPYRYVTVYDIETDDLESTLAQLGKTVQSGTKTDASDPSRRAIWVYTPVGSRKLAK